MTTTAHTFDLPESLVQALRLGQGVLVAGPTASGKTTLLSQLSVESDCAPTRCILSGDLRVSRDSCRKAVEIAGMGMPISSTIHAGSARDAWTTFAQGAGITFEEAQEVFPVVVLMTRLGRERTIQTVEHSA